jgi:hypothetical protein
MKNKLSWSIAGVLLSIPLVAQAAEPPPGYNPEFDAKGEYDEMPGYAYIGKNSDQIAQTASSGAAPAAKISAGVTTPVPVYNSYLNWGDGFGNSTWGARYNASASSTAGSNPVGMDVLAPGDYANLDTTLGAYVTAAGKEVRLVQIHGQFATKTNPQQADGKAELIVLGKQLNDWKIPVGRYSKPKSLFNFPMDLPPFPALGYDLLGVHLSITLGIGGSIYTNVVGTVYYDGVNATLVPGAEAHAIATATAGSNFANIWVRSTVNLLKIETPIRATLAWTQTQLAPNQCRHAIAAQVRGDLTLRSLNGRIRAGYTLGWSWIKKGVTLYSWSGLEHTTNIFNSVVFPWSAVRNTNCTSFVPTQQI